MAGRREVGPAALRQRDQPEELTAEPQATIEEDNMAKKQTTRNDYRTLARYEVEKQRLRRLRLSPEEYQRRIAQLAAKLGI